MPPQTNARLTAVNAADTGTGGRDDWDAPAPASTPDTAPAGAVKWSGDADAYYRQKVQRTPDGSGGLNIVEVRTLFVDSAVARASGVDTDDVITFTDPAGVVRRARASSIALSELDGVPSDLQTARLELDER